MEALAGAYLWIKGVHVLAVIAWMAGLLYLPRLFVYHADARPGSETSETFKVMERRLYRAIMHPARARTVLSALRIVARCVPLRKNWTRCSPRRRVSGAGAGPSTWNAPPAVAGSSRRTTSVAAVIASSNDLRQ